jgi:hypothetical protein
MESKYIMDTNVFIFAHRNIYPFDVAPSFWEQLVTKAADKILIIEEVQNEILKGKDLLADWYSSQSSNFTILREPSQEVIDAYRKIINSVNGDEIHTQSAKQDFAMVADSWLCAYAMAYGSTLVTLETYQAGVKKKVKIPNVCKQFDIRYIDLLQFMRETGITL